jgi:hypothetical protein
VPRFRREAEAAANLQHPNIVAIRFPCTALGKGGMPRRHVLGHSLRRRRMLRILERIVYQAGYERTSAWAFTRRGVSRHCSVTVPLYVGLGASGGTYLQDVFYLNTFGVADCVVGKLWGASRRDAWPEEVVL